MTECYPADFAGAPKIAAAAFSFCLGACIASFLNVVAWRVPRGESVSSPPSHCPKCGAPIRWWQNVPVLSYLALRGRCASCAGRISPRYPIVEALGAFLFLGAFFRFGFFAPLAWAWLSLMLAGSLIDIDHKLLPDFTTVGGMVLGVGSSVAFWAVGAFTPYHFHNFAPERFYIHPLESLCGLAAGFGLLWLVRFFGSIVFKREAMGMGDVFLMGAIGAVSGPKAVVATLVLSSFAGSIAGLSMIALSKTKLGSFAEIPFGPYLCAGSAAWLFCGPELERWYLSLIGF